MPNKTLYVREADLELFDRAQREWSGSVSAAFAEFLRERFEAGSSGQAGQRCSGSLLVNPEMVVGELAALIEERSRTWASDGDWTMAVKDCITRLYREHGASQIRCTSRVEGTSEFLLDLCAYSGNHIELAVESEWNPNINKTREDFEKLLHIKAWVKLMVCDSPPFEQNIRNVSEFLAGYPDHRRGEEYIIFNCRCNRGLINCHRWRPGADGPIPAAEIEFETVPGFPRVFDRAKWDVRKSGSAWIAEVEGAPISAPTAAPHQPKQVPKGRMDFELTGTFYPEVLKVYKERAATDPQDAVVNGVFALLIRAAPLRAGYMGINLPDGSPERLNFCNFLKDVARNRITGLGRFGRQAKWFVETVCGDRI